MSSNLASLVSEDSRSPIQRLRRHQLWKIADAKGVSYPTDATASTMVVILEAAGVDVMAPLPNGEHLLRPVPVKHQDGSVSTELMSVTKPHATSGQNIDYDSRIEQASVENEALTTENAGLAKQMADMVARFDKLAAENAELRAEAPSNKAPGKKSKATSKGADLT